MWSPTVMVVISTCLVLVYCLDNICINVVRNPGRPAIFPACVDLQPTAYQGNGSQRFPDCYANNDKTTSACIRDVSVRQFDVPRQAFSQLLPRDASFLDAKQRLPMDDTFPLTITPTPTFQLPSPQPRHPYSTFTWWLQDSRLISVSPQQQHAVRHEKSLLLDIIHDDASTLIVPPHVVHRRRSRPCTRDPAVAGGDSFLIHHPLCWRIDPACEMPRPHAHSLGSGSIRSHSSTPSTEATELFSYSAGRVRCFRCFKDYPSPLLIMASVLSTIYGFKSHGYRLTLVHLCKATYLMMLSHTAEAAPIHTVVGPSTYFYFSLTEWPIISFILTLASVTMVISLTLSAGGHSDEDWTPDNEDDDEDEEELWQMDLPDFGPAAAVSELEQSLEEFQLPSGTDVLDDPQGLPSLPLPAFAFGLPPLPPPDADDPDSGRVCSCMATKTVEYPAAIDRHCWLSSQRHRCCYGYTQRSQKPLQQQWILWCLLSRQDPGPIHNNRASGCCCAAGDRQTE